MPTLIGITLIIALIASAILYFHKKAPEKLQEVGVTDLQTVNIFATSATIVWQTEQPVIGEVVFNQSENLREEARDNRDRGQSEPRITHFVTLKNLKPNTKYFYKIKNDGVESAEKVIEFITAASPPSSNEPSFSFLKPLKGTILNTNFNPIDESLIFLTIPGAQNLATFSSTAGNFILPLKQVYTQNLDQLFTITPDTPAILVIQKGNLQSKVNILISDTTVGLPPISIGNNLDLTNYQPQPISIISIGQNIKVKLDFNNDGIINSLDLAILRGKANSKQVLSLEEQSGYDINSDGIVNQKDVDEFSKALIGR